MADYNFSTLSSSDLEDLICDLWNAELPTNSIIRYKTFKEGKDKGIDILYSSTSNPYDHVGQVKHFVGTGFDGLIKAINNTEVAKVNKLQPNRYLFATSIDLTVKQSELIRDAFHPFLKVVNDIYGKQDINRLLQKHEQVLTSHFKLWFSDTAVLTKILNADLYYRTADFIESELTKRLRLYVQTPTLYAARQSLEENNFVIITGDPGVGKSTLAEMLVYEYIKDDYELLYIHDDIKEVEKFLKPDESKQLIYFDDFLGSNSVEINKAQGSETALASIIRRIKRLKNKRLIFTTRVHILNTVLDQSEKLTKLNIRSSEAIFNLLEYDKEIKDRLLRNHIEEAEIDDELKSVLMETDIFNFIVNHNSFNPRSVEYITSKENVKDFSKAEYKGFIKQNFDNPREIWAHAYRHQIGHAERILLNTLLTFDQPTELDHLEKAFHKRISTEPLSAFEINPFRTALTRLDKGFIRIKNKRVDFHNPSLKDFIRHFLTTDPHEIQRMLDSICSAAFRLIVGHGPSERIKPFE